jgi:peptidoglycan-associated lipoprotein
MVNTSKLKKLSVFVCLVTVMVLAGCHKKVVAPPPPSPPPPAPAAPAASIDITPRAIGQGQTAMLSWSTTNATSAFIDGIGAVSPNGSRSVSPTTSTSYTLTAKGPGGSVQASTRITVNVPPPPPPPPPPSMTEEQIFEQNVHDVYFDYDKSTLRAQDLPIADEDARFLRQHPDMKVVIGGHCDERGSAEYNIALGQNRALSLQKLLEDKGIPASQLRVVSYGKEKPFCSESTEECWQQNRRDHLVLDK